MNFSNRKTIFCFAPLLLSASALAGYICPHPVDQKQIVFMIAGNGNPAEIESAAKAACERGEGFESFPSEDLVNSLNQRDAVLKAKWNSYKNRCYQLTNLRCQTEYSSLADAQNSLDNDSTEICTKETITDKFKGFSEKGTTLTSIVVSAHDGGGNVHGNFLPHIGKMEIIGALKDAYKDKPELLNKLSSVFMWGCWTMGPSEIQDWKNQLPDLKMMSGFFDMAPLGNMPASQTVLHDLLSDEKNIEDASDKEKLKGLIAKATNINQTYASVYVQNQCGNNYYYTTTLLISIRRMAPVM